MDVVPTNLTSGSLDAASSATTDSISPGTNTLILITVTSRTNISTDPNEPTVSGCDLNWIPVDSVVWDTSGASRKRSTAFRAMGTPTPGTLEIDFGGQSQTDTVWIVDEFTGVDTSGADGSGAVVQCVTGFSNTQTQNFLEITLAGFGDAGNATYGVLAEAAFDTVITNGSGFTRVAVVTGQGTQLVMDSQFRADNDTSVTWTASRDIEGGGFGFEIASASAASYTLDADSGSISLLGQTASLRAARKLTAQQGALAEVGNDAALRVDRRLTAAVGSLALAGVDAQVRVDRKLSTGTPAFTLAGQIVSLQYGRKLSPSAAMFTLSGQVAQTKAARQVSAVPTSFVLVGGSVQFQTSTSLRSLPSDTLAVGSVGDLRIGRNSTTTKIGPDQ